MLLATMASAFLWTAMIHTCLFSLSNKPSVVSHQLYCLMDPVMVPIDLDYVMSGSHAKQPWLSMTASHVQILRLQAVGMTNLLMVQGGQAGSCSAEGLDQALQ